MDLSPYLKFAETTAREAGQLTLEYFQTAAATPEFKGDDTPVTIADKKAEQLIRSRIEAAARPDDGRPDSAGAGWHSHSCKSPLRTRLHGTLGQ